MHMIILQLLANTITAVQVLKPERMGKFQGFYVSAFTFSIYVGRELSP